MEIFKMEIKVLGPGCPNCQRLEKNARAAVAGLGVEATITKVSDMKEIMAYDVFATPGLVIDEKVVVSGRVPNQAEITTLITTALAERES
jgi:small redox-active disulfide protein 2